jgi:hypothetical protein
MGKIIIILFLLSLVACSPQGYRFSGNIDSEFYSEQTGNLKEILALHELNAEYALLIASDGIAVLISEPSFPRIEIYLDAKKISTRSEFLPPVSNLNDLSEIVIYNWKHPVVDRQTPFSLRLLELQFLGESSLNGHLVRKYQLSE